MDHFTNWDPEKVLCLEVVALKQPIKLFTCSKRGFRWEDLVGCLEMMTGCEVLKWQGGGFSKRTEVERDSKVKKRTLCLNCIEMTVMLKSQTALLVFPHFWCFRVLLGSLKEHSSIGEGSDRMQWQFKHQMLENMLIKHHQNTPHR